MASNLTLVELDSLEIVDLVDNEIDFMSQYTKAGDLNTISQTGRLLSLAAHFFEPKSGQKYPEFRLDEACCGAHGLSLVVRGTKGESRQSLLFDTGPEEEVWEQNVSKLKEDVSKIDRIVLSHWHRDHSGGMLRAVKVIGDRKTQGGSKQNVVVDLHPARPERRGLTTPRGPAAMEADPAFDDVEKAGATVHKSDQAHTVQDNHFLISGEIPRHTEYEQGFRGGLTWNKEAGEWVADPLIKDERLVMCKVKDKGLVVITGCGHAGVVNTVKHALSLAGGSERLHAVVGGFHLVDADEERLRKTISDLKEFEPDILLPGHCTGWRAKMEIEKQMPGRLAPLGVGNTFRFGI